MPLPLKTIFYNYLPKYTNKWFWLGLAFVIKLSLFIYFLHQADKSIFEFNTKVIAQSTGDTFSYLTPIDNLLQSGNYDPDYRMPGYGVVYLLFRIFFNQMLGVESFDCYAIAFNGGFSLLPRINSTIYFQIKEVFSYHLFHLCIQQLSLLL